MARPLHVRLNRATQAGNAKAANHLPSLTRAYARALRAGGRRAAARFRQVETLTAAADRQAPPAWVIPETQTLIDQGQLATDTDRKTGKIHRLILAASGTEALRPFGIRFDIHAPASQAILDSYSARIRETVGAAIAEQVTGAIQTGYQQGQSVAQVSAAIQRATADVSGPRADMLARSDLNGISNAGSLLAARTSAAAATKTWTATLDDRTRPDHAEADGQTVGIAEMFDVGGEEASHPGDPSLSWAESANCRCTLTYGGVSAGQGVSVFASAGSPGVLYLARHALTAYDSDDNAKDTIRGWADDPLNAKGVAEAERMAASLTGVGVTSVTSSDLERAAKTAAPVGDALAVAVTETDALRPWNLGDFQGRTSDDARDDIAWYVDHPDSPVPGGESFAAFSGRFLPCLTDAMARAENGASPLLVTHSHNLKLALVWMRNGRQPVCGDDFMVTAPGPASVTACDPAEGWAASELIHDGAPAEQTGHVPAEVNYRPADSAARQCGVCDFYRAPHCTMFSGDPVVIATYTCDRFVAKSTGNAVTSGGNMPPFDVERLTETERAELRALLEEPLTVEQQRLSAARAALAANGVGHVYDDDEVTAILSILEAFAGKHAYAGDGGPCKICGKAGSNKDAHFAAVTFSGFSAEPILAAATGGTQWQATLCVAGEPTVDSGIKRLLDVGGGSWLPLPRPLGLLDDTPHAEVKTKAPICGRIDQIWWAGNVCQASGVFFDGSDDPKLAEAGSKAAALVAELHGQFGVSVDLVDIDAELMVWNGSGVASMDDAQDPTAHQDMADPNAPGGPATEATLPDDIPVMDEEADPEDVEYVMCFKRWVIAGATICPVQALTEATISIVASAFDRVAEWRTTSVFTSPPLTAAAAGLVPVEPPGAWFDDPQLEGPTPLTITDEGRVFGHLAAWDTCHTGRPGCVPPPRSPSGYMNFHLGEVVTAEGDRVAVGTLTFDAPHAPLQMSASQTVRHYDDTATSGAHVRAGEDAYGIWLAGALNPRLSAEDARTLMAAPPSGDWRQVQNGQPRDLVGAHAVNQPGFIVQRRGLSLAAAAACEPCEETLDRELAALAASVDGVEGLAALVEA